MTVARSVADVLDGHVTLEFEFMDRMHQRRRRPVLPGRLRGRRRGALRRQGPGEDDRLSYREASEPLTDKSYPCWIVQTTVSSEPATTSTASTADFGPFFIRFRTCVPLQPPSCAATGNEWAKRQADQGRHRVGAARQRLLVVRGPRALASASAPASWPHEDRPHRCASGCDHLPGPLQRTAGPAIATTSRSSRPSSR